MDSEGRDRTHEVDVLFSARHDFHTKKIMSDGSEKTIAASYTGGVRPDTVDGAKKSAAVRY